MLISICICTYNRSEILAYCLNSLILMDDPRPEHDVEIIVVDNNSNDDTRTVVTNLISRCPFKLRYVFEEQQGISAARNRAIREATGTYCAFLDDECIVDRNWLSVAIGDIIQFNPSIIGGPYYGAFLPGDHPKWFKVEYGDAPFITQRYGKGFQEKFRASSGNMFVRRDVFENVLFDVTMGPKGDQLKIGEETDLQERFLRDHRSESIFYDPELIVHHFIRVEKMKLSYRAKRAIVTSLSASGTVGHRTFLSALFKAAIHAALSPFLCVWRDRTRYPFWQNIVYERIIPATCFRAGMIAKYLREHFVQPSAAALSKDTNTIS